MVSQVKLPYNAQLLATHVMIIQGKYCTAGLLVAKIIANKNLVDFYFCALTKLP